MSEIRYFAEKPQKIWAFTPRPDFATFDDIDQYLRERDMQISRALGGTPTKEYNSSLNQDVLQDVLQMCTLGLAHTEDLARRRLERALEAPRKSFNRLYQMSFVEPAYWAGSLAVVAYTAYDDSQPEEWTVEGFLGDAVEPEEYSLRMDYPTVFGIDVVDQENLNRHIDEWYPATK